MNTNISRFFNVRYLIVAIMAFAGFWLFRTGTDSERFSAGAQGLALVVGLILFVAATVLLYGEYRAAPTTDDVAITQPRLVHFLLHSSRASVLWLGARLYLGYEWLEAGREKVGNDAWMSGAGLKGYWEHAIAIPEQGRPAITYDLYREYIQYMLDRNWYTWFADVVAYGELLIGIGPIVGGLTGVAAFFGALMNTSFMLAGSASTNPVLFTLSIAIILAWRVAGLIGVDRVLLPALGAPWSPGRLRHRVGPEVPAAST